MYTFVIKNKLRSLYKTFEYKIKILLAISLSSSREW